MIENDNYDDFGVEDENLSCEGCIADSCEGCRFLDITL